MWYSPGQSSMFNARVIGVVTKIDLATRNQIDEARQVLVLAGVEEIFEVSNMEGDGIDALLAYLVGLDETDGGRI